MDKPNKVRNAERLLYISLAIGLLGIGLDVDFSWRDMAQLVFVIATYAILAIALPLFLIYKIGKGRNWARITFLILFIIFGIRYLGFCIFYRSCTSTSTFGYPD